MRDINSTHISNIEAFPRVQSLKTLRPTNGSLLRETQMRKAEKPTLGFSTTRKNHAAIFLNPALFPTYPDAYHRNLNETILVSVEKFRFGRISRSARVLQSLQCIFRLVRFQMHSRSNRVFVVFCIIRMRDYVK